jgi:hypothetical protein
MKWDWTVVDSLLAQLTAEEEAWVTVCSSSQWATRLSSDFLPSSPAADDAIFARFVRALVSRCAGRVQYWQCNNEPSNVGLLWAGSAGDYAAQLAVFARAVRDAHPNAAVVLGGCGYDVLSASPGEPARQFFDHVLGVAGAWFDLFAVHLYDSPSLIPTHIETVPLFHPPEVQPALHRAMAAAFDDSDPDFSTDGLAVSAGLETPERRAMKVLYARMSDLPPPLQMLMAGCSPALEQRRHRINRREIVSGNLFAFSTGVRRTVAWHLAPEIAHYEDPFTMMELLQGKPLLMRHDDEGRLTRRQPAGDTFRLLAAHVDGARSVERVPLDRHPDVRAVTMKHRDRGPVVVL